MTMYKLSQAEMDLAHKTGQARTQRAKNAGLNAKTWSKRGKVFIESNGAAGEIALAGILLREGLIGKTKHQQLLDDIFNAGVSSAYAGTDNGDIDIGGLTIDIKATEWAGGYLPVSQDKLRAKLIKHYVLITGDIEGQRSPCDEFTFRGWRSAGWLSKHHNRGSEGIGKHNQKDLLGLRDLCAMIEKMPYASRYTVAEMRHMEDCYYHDTISDAAHDPIAEARFAEMLGELSRYYHTMQEDIGVYDHDFDELPQGAVIERVAYTEYMACERSDDDAFDMQDLFNSMM